MVEATALINCVLAAWDKRFAFQLPIRFSIEMDKWRKLSFLDLSRNISNPRCLERNREDCKLKRELRTLVVSWDVFILKRVEDFEELINLDYHMFMQNSS